MHILIIPSEQYIPKDNPIAGIFQHDQAKILYQKGNKVGVLSFSFNHSFSSLLKMFFGKKSKAADKYSCIEVLNLFYQKIFWPYKSAIQYENIDGIDVVRCDGFWGIKTSTLPLVKLNLWLKYGEKALKNYIKIYGKPDVIHAHNMIYAGLLSIQIQKKHDIPIIITEHSSQYAMEGVDPSLEEKIKSIYQNLSSIFAVSPKLIDLLTKKYLTGSNNTIECLPNVLDPVIEKRSLNNQTNLSKVRFLNIGNLIPLKGQQELITAFAIAFEQISNVELIIAGSGELKNTLQKQINQLGLQEKISLIGLIDREEVINQMDQANLFVLPSHYETFGVVLIEALSRGIPVISTYSGGPECIVNHKNGLLVEPKNTQELSEALIKMYGQYNNYNPTTLREDVINQYGKNTFYNKLIRIYKDATH